MYIVDRKEVHCLGGGGPDTTRDQDHVKLKLA